MLPKISTYFQPPPPPPSQFCQSNCENILHTVTAEIFVRVKISYSSVRELSYAVKFRTARTMSHTLLYMHGFRMLLNFVFSTTESTKSTKLNRVRNFCDYSTEKLQFFVRCPFSYFWLESGSRELIFALSRASKHNDVEIWRPQSKKKFSYRLQYSIKYFFQKYESTKISTVRKFVTLQ